MGGRFVETDGWKARITVDCLLKGKLCGSFRYETLACEGDLIYIGEGKQIHLDDPFVHDLRTLNSFRTPDHR